MSKLAIQLHYHQDDDQMLVVNSLSTVPSSEISLRVHTMQHRESRPSSH